MKRSSATKIRNWINSLGLPFSNLVDQGIVSDSPLLALYEDSDTLDLEPVPGIELSFGAESKIFKAMYITVFSNDAADAPVYAGDLPPPYNDSLTKDKVREIFGNPLRSHGVMRFTEPVSKTIGGWDFYMLDDFQNPGVQVEFQYDEQFKLEKMVFTWVCDID